MYALIYPKFNLSFLFPVAFIGLIFAAQKEDNGKHLFIHSCIAGSISNMLMLYWIYPTLTLNGVNIFASILALLIISTYLGIYWGVFALAVRSIREMRWIGKILLIPALWVLLEYIKTYLFTGFPWLLAGYSMWRVPELLQLASFTGIYGLSYISLFINTGLALTIISKKIMPVICSLAVTLFLFIYGGSAVKQHSYSGDTRVSILQGNVSQYKKFNKTFSREILGTYGALHEKAIKYKPELIVWPETALPAPLTSDYSVNSFVMNLIKDSGAYQLMGSIEENREFFYNSAYVIDPSGEISVPYRKMHLTPFGEYFPLRNFLTLFTDVVDQYDDFDAGKESRLLKANTFNIATGICFEEIFPGIIRNFFKNGADLFVNITNDGWFLNTAGPYQHFIHSMVRAIENRTFVIRSANTGISAIIAPSGKVIMKTGLLKTTVLNGTIAATEKITFYSKYGDVFVGLCFILAVLIIWEDKKVCLKNIKTKLLK
jgi:apolipoprotein N-acyltransferase